MWYRFHDDNHRYIFFLFLFQIVLNHSLAFKSAAFCCTQSLVPSRSVLSSSYPSTSLYFCNTLSFFHPLLIPFIRPCFYHSFPRFLLLFPRFPLPTLPVLGAAIPLGVASGSRAAVSRESRRNRVFRAHLSLSWSFLLWAFALLYWFSHFMV